MSYLTAVTVVDPAAVYDAGHNGTDTPLRIKKGGAGQSGLIEALANAFIDYSVEGGQEAFKVAWYKSDTTVTINHLKAGVLDIVIIYSEVAERLAINKAIATAPSYYAFRDHFLLVGPTSNPAKLDKFSDIETMFSDLYTAAEAGTSDPPIRFLSRCDKSATNLKEALLFTRIGQLLGPLGNGILDLVSPNVAFPIQALKAAILLKEYTIIDRGRYLSIPTALQKNAII